MEKAFASAKLPRYSPRYVLRIGALLALHLRSTEVRYGGTPYSGSSGEGFIPASFKDEGINNDDCVQRRLLEFYSVLYNEVIEKDLCIGLCDFSLEKQILPVDR